MLRHTCHIRPLNFLNRPRLKLRICNSCFGNALVFCSRPAVGITTAWNWGTSRKGHGNTSYCGVTLGVYYLRCQEEETLREEQKRDAVYYLKDALDDESIYQSHYAVAQPACYRGQTMMLRARMMALFCWTSTALCASQPFGVDLNGHPIDRLAPPGSPAIVLFFAASDCPISNRYVPEIERIEREFKPAGVRFWWVYPNPEETPEAVRHHQQQFDIHADVVLDNRQRLTAIAHATITPEAAILVSSGTALREVYRGRIDDRYLSLGQERPSANRHDLEDALHALLANRPIPAPGGPPVGCSIVPLNKP